MDRSNILVANDDENEGFWNVRNLATLLFTLSVVEGSTKWLYYLVDQLTRNQ
jgi:hypothetical protein